MRILKINNHADLMGMKPLKGWEDALLSPPERKKIVYNDNASIDGTRAILAKRRVNKRSFSIQFYLSKVDGKYNYYTRLREIEEMLADGVNNTGRTEMQVEIGTKKITFYLVYESIDKYQCFGGDRALLTIKFTELNPNNRLVE